MNKIYKKLKSLAEYDYKAFNLKIIPTKQKVLGVRLPILRKTAKDIASSDNPFDFIELDKKNVYDMIMLEGMVLSYLNISFKKLLPHTEKFLSKVDNWAQIDSTICDYKNIQKEKGPVLKTVKKWVKSDKEFTVRAALVVLLAHYIEEENLDMIFKISESVKHKAYYVHMANAWLISACMAKFPEQTKSFFAKNKLDNITHNKAIQKSRESFRVSKEDKEIINKLKRKS